jgi:uncharacterized protein involved in copper resistance
MKRYIMILAVFAFATAASAQQMGHMQHMQKDTTPKKAPPHDHAKMMAEMQHDTTKLSMGMTSQFSLDLPMNRDGFGYLMGTRRNTDVYVHGAWQKMDANVPWKFFCAV